VLLGEELEAIKQDLIFKDEKDGGGPGRGNWKRAEQKGKLILELGGLGGARGRKVFLLFCVLP